MSSVTNICGLVVHVAPSRAAGVRAAIEALPGCDVHLEGEGGRLVVTVMDEGASLALDRMADIHRMDGVVSAALAYHHLEDLTQPAAQTCACGEASCSSHPETHDVR